MSRLTARAARGTASATALAILLAGGATGVGWAAAPPRADRTDRADRADAAAVAVATASGRLTRTSVDALVGGGTVTRWQQRVDGLQVLGGQVVVARDAAGSTVHVAAATSPATAPALTGLLPPAAARSIARRDSAVRHRIPARRLTAGPADLALFDPSLLHLPDPSGARPVWRTTVTDGALVVDEIWVDARTGAVALVQDRTPEALDRRVCDAADTSAGIPCVSPARAEGDPVSGIDEVDAAYDAAGATYVFLRDQLGRDSYDDAGAPLRVTVRYRAGSCPYANASWTGTQVLTGTGFGRADDVIAHEIGHGLTSATSQLIYAGQSGAINETLSDVLGELVDLSTPDDGARWEIGEDTGAAFRDMADPARFGDPDRITSPLWATGPADAYGVHTNSGVGNRFVSLLVDGGTFNGRTVTGIGVDATARIVFGAALLLTPAASYADLAAAVRAACVVAAEGGEVTADDCAQADTALRAVEMDLPAPGTTPCDDGSCPTTPVPPGAPEIGSITVDDGGLVVSFVPGPDGSAPPTNVEFSLDSGSTWTPRSPASAASPLVIPGVAEGRSYWVAIRLVNAAGVGSRSASVTVTVPPDPVPSLRPAAPTAVRARVRNGRVTVRWRLAAAVAGPGARVELQARTARSAWTTVARPAATTTSLRWRPSRPVLLVRVRTIADGDGPGPWSPAVRVRPARAR